MKKRANSKPQSPIPKRINFDKGRDDNLRDKEEEFFKLTDDLLQCCMFYMEKKELFNFIITCRNIYDVFDRAACEGVEKRRVDILNNRQVDVNCRVLDLFSYQSSDGKLMMTYDRYFRMKSLIVWPSHYYHDEKQFETVVSLSEAKEVNAKAVSQPLENIYANEFKKYVVPQQDSYYLSMNDFVIRKISDGLRCIERAVFPSDNCKHCYVDSMPSETSFFRNECETIVRFFKKPQQMTFNDFENEFKNYILDDLGRLFIYDCIFEYNKTTKTKERFVVSGGCLLNCLTRCGMQDIDIYIINNGEDEHTIANAIYSVLNRYDEKTRSLPFKYNIMKSRTTINICPYGNVIQPRKELVTSNHNFQLILLNFNSIEELLIFFDLDCCKLAFDGRAVFTLPECLRALKYKINILPKHTNTELNYHRAIKYGKRGFKTVFIRNFDHPLAHLIHVDYYIENLRKVTENIYLRDDHYFIRYYSQRQYGTAGCKSYGTDESYLYPIVLRNVNYYFVELCLKKGLVGALELMKTRHSSHIFHVCTLDGKDEFEELLNLPTKEEDEALKSIIKEVMFIDRYAFAKDPSELFKITSLDELTILVKQKYSDEHLRRKFSILHCDRCKTFLYAPILCEAKNDMERDYWTLVYEHPEIRHEDTFKRCKEKVYQGLDITKETYIEYEHLLCEKCLEIVRCE